MPIPPYAIYNIGNNQPENLLDFVIILQEELVRAGVLAPYYDFDAHKKLVPMQPGDVPVAAHLIRDQILGQENAWAQLFSPQRFTPAASAGQLLEEGLHAARDLARLPLMPPRAAAETLPPGHGGPPPTSSSPSAMRRDAPPESAL